MLNEKKIAEELYASKQKQPNNIVGKFLYYERAIYPTMLMALNSMVYVKKKPTTDTAKQITEFFNYSASHPEVVT